MDIGVYIFGENPEVLNPATMQLNNPEAVRQSEKNCGLVEAFAANTNQGIVRNYNEDRVSIILNVNKPANKRESEWPAVCFFGVFDGHGGSACADFLKDNLHNFVI